MLQLRDRTKLFPINKVICGGASTASSSGLVEKETRYAGRQKRSERIDIADKEKEKNQWILNEFLSFCFVLFHSKVCVHVCAPESFCSKFINATVICRMRMGKRTLRTASSDCKCIHPRIDDNVSYKTHIFMFFSHFSRFFFCFSFIYFGIGWFWKICSARTHTLISHSSKFN